MERNELREHRQMNGADAGVVGPGREAASDYAKEHAGEDEQRDDDGAGPASAEVGELGDGLGEDHLIGVALKVAQDRWSEDRGDDDHAEDRQSCSSICSVA